MQKCILDGFFFAESNGPTCPLAPQKDPNSNVLDDVLAHLGNFGKPGFSQLPGRRHANSHCFLAPELSSTKLNYQAQVQY